MTQDTTMLKFPVATRQETAGDFTAWLMDVPDGPKARGGSAQEAYANLLSDAVDFVTGMMLDGQILIPSSGEGHPTIDVGFPSGVANVLSPADLVYQPVARKIVLARLKGGIARTYSWRNHILIFRQ